MSVPIAQWAFRRLGKFSGRRSRAIPAVRVYVDPVEHPAAEKFVDRDAERLALDVPQRLLDPADGGEHDRTAALSPERVVIHLGPDFLDTERIAADEHALAQILDHARRRGAAEPVGDAASPMPLTPSSVTISTMTGCNFPLAIR